MTAAAQPAPDPNTQNYEQWLRTTYGNTFAETFPIVYGTKYHTTTMDRLVTDCDWSANVPAQSRGASRAAPSAIPWGFRATWIPSATRRTAGFDDLPRTVRQAVRGEASSDGLFRWILARNAFASPTASKHSTQTSYRRIPLPDLVPLIVGAPADVLCRRRKASIPQPVALFNFGIDREGSFGDRHHLFLRRRTSSFRE